jgi:enamine deaminase RidA (YjgF/YER057c/UK114 family)
MQPQERAVAVTRFSNPKGLSKPPGYTHVVEITGPARIVYIAGQLGVDRGGQLVSQDFRAQAVRVFENLKTALASVGARFQDVVKLNNYLGNVSDLPVLREVREKYLTHAEKPASTTLAVAGFARDDALLEIEAVAVLPGKSAAKPAAKRGARPAKSKSPSSRAAKPKAGRGGKRR